MNNLTRFFLAFFFGILTFPTFAQWHSTGGPYFSYNTSIALENDNYLFMLTASQCLRTSDKGDTWEILGNGLPEFYQNINYSLYEQKIGLIIKHIDETYLSFISEDNGNSWQQLNVPATHTLGQIELVANKIFLLNNDEFIVSDDMGQNWNNVGFPDTLSLTNSSIHASGDVLYVQTNDEGAYYSNNLGLNWLKIPNPTSPFSEFVIRSLYVRNGILIVGASSSPNSSQMAYISYDNGTNWTSSNDFYFYAGNQLAVGNGIIYKINNNSTLEKSEDEGLTWQSVFGNGSNFLQRLFVDNDGIIYLNINSKLHRSFDNGNTWIKFYPPSVAAYFLPSIGYLQLINGELYFFNAFLGLQKVNPQNWDYSYEVLLYDQFANLAIDYHFAGDTMIVMDNLYKIYVSTDAGLTWLDKTSYGTDGDPIWSAGGTNFSFIYGGIFIGKGNELYYSPDLGNTWQGLGQYIDDLAGDRPYAIAGHKNSLFISNYYGVFRSDDNGVTWQPKNIGLENWVSNNSNMRATTLFPLEDRIFVLRHDQDVRLFQSSDNGETWQYANNGLPNYVYGNNNINDLRQIGNSLILALGENLYYSEDNGFNWVFWDKLLTKIYSYESFDNSFVGASDYYGILERQVHPLPPSNVFHGKVFEDTNNNGAQEPFEEELPGVVLNIPAIRQGTVTANDGSYSVTTPAAGNSSIKFLYDPFEDEYTVATPDEHFLTDTNTSYDFAIYKPPFNPASGNVFVDANNNGTQDVGEDGLADAIIYFSQFTNIARTDSAGAYLISVPAIDDTIRVNPHHKYAVLTPPFYVTIPDSNEYNFAVNYPTNIHDASVSIYPSGSATRGFTHDYIILVKNEGTEVDSVSVQVELDPQLELLQMNVPAQSANGNILSWIIPSPPVSQYSIIALTVKVPTDTPLGNEIEVNATVNIEGFTDADIEDNAVTLTQEVVGSYDPNDKQVTPSGDFFTTQIGEGEGLNYTIRFQNTGTAPARKVVILDTLDVDLDFSTLEIMAFSHPMTWNLRDTGIVEFIFDNINLPDSTTNEPESHGFVAYSIKCPKDIIQGSEIKNAADIYFDFNEPIRTNTVTSPIKRSEIVQPVATFTLCEGDILNGQVYETSTVIGDTVSFEFFDSIYLTQINVLPTYFANVDTSAALGTVFLGQTINTDTTINLSLLASNGCDSTVVYEIKVLTGNIETIEEAQGFRIIPNPTNGVATIEFYGLVNLGGTLSVSNPLGQQLLQVAVKSSEKIQIDLSGQAQGIYFVKFDSHKGSMTKRLLKT